MHELGRRDGDWPEDFHSQIDASIENTRHGFSEGEIPAADGAPSPEELGELTMRPGCGSSFGTLFAGMGMGWRAGGYASKNRAGQQGDEQ